MISGRRSALVGDRFALSITGLILLFPVHTRFLLGVLLPASKIVHSYEAVLAFWPSTWHLTLPIS